MTHKEFFALLGSSSSDFDYVAGKTFPIARESYYHSILVSKLGCTVSNAHRKSLCRSFIRNLSVYIESADAIRTPDVVVACPPNVINARQGLIDNPTLLVEVTSPSTRASDHSDKLREYASLDSTRHYILVDSEAMHVQSFSRQEDGAWRFEILTRAEEMLAIPTLNLTLSLAEIYGGIVFDAEDSPVATETV